MGQERSRIFPGIDLTLNLIDCIFWMAVGVNKNTRNVFSSQTDKTSEINMEIVSTCFCFTIIRSSLMRKIQENSADRIFPKSFFFLYKNRVDHLEIQRIDEGINSTRNFSISLLQIHPLIGRALSSGLLLVNPCLVSCVANSSITCVHCTVSSVICCF